MCYWLNLLGSGDNSDTTGVFGRMKQELCCQKSPSHSLLPPYWMLLAAYCPICCLYNREKKKITKNYLGEKQNDEDAHLNFQKENIARE